MCSSFDHKGWKFKSNQSKIVSDIYAQELSAKHGIVHFPEMLFGNTFLNLAHTASGFLLSMNAIESITCSPSLPFDYFTTKIKGAKNMADFSDQIHVAEDGQNFQKQQNFESIVSQKGNKLDWTFSTCYRGGLSGHRDIQQCDSVSLDFDLLSVNLNNIT